MSPRKDLSTQLHSDARARAHTAPRDPGFYRADSEHSYFRDLALTTVREHDSGAHSNIGLRPGHPGRLDAEVRLDALATYHAARGNYRAVGSSGNTGILPPDWLAAEFAPAARPLRVVANVVHHVDLPDSADTREIDLGYMSAGIDSVPGNVAPQGTEGSNAGLGADAVTSVKQTVTPQFHAVFQDVSRQLMFASGGVFDRLLMADITAAWDAWIETNLCSVILAQGTAFGTSFTDTTFTGSAPVLAVRSMATAASKAKRGRADVAVMSVAREEAFLALTNTNGEWLVHSSTDADSAPVDIRGIPVASTQGIDDALSPDKFAVLQSQAVSLFESALADFSFEQTSAAPSVIRVGASGVATALVRFPTAVQVCSVTAS